MKMNLPKLGGGLPGEHQYLQTEHSHRGDKEQCLVDPSLVLVQAPSDRIRGSTDFNHRYPY